MALRAMLDTNIVSVLMHDPLGPLLRRITRFGHADTCISIVTVAELRFGAAKNPSARAVANLGRVAEAFAVLPFESPADEAYGTIRAQLESIGKPIGPNDLFIAAHALSLGLILVTANIREFSRVPGLAVENWLD
jgi:tRNA(fMet)-specific endonuclease VapC